MGKLETPLQKNIDSNIGYSDRIKGAPIAVSVNSYNLKLASFKKLSTDNPSREFTASSLKNEELMLFMSSDLATDILINKSNYDGMYKPYANNWIASLDNVRIRSLVRKDTEMQEGMTQSEKVGFLKTAEDKIRKRDTRIKNEQRFNLKTAPVVAEELVDVRYADMAEQNAYPIHSYEEKKVEQLEKESESKFTNESLKETDDIIGRFLERTEGRRKNERVALGLELTVSHEPVSLSEKNWTANAGEDFEYPDEEKVPQPVHALEVNSNEVVSEGRPEVTSKTQTQIGEDFGYGNENEVRETTSSNTREQSVMSDGRIEPTLEGDFVSKEMEMIKKESLEMMGKIDSLLGERNKETIENLKACGLTGISEDLETLKKISPKYGVTQATVLAGVFVITERVMSVLRDEVLDSPIIDRAKGGELRNKLHTALYTLAPLASDRERVIGQLGETVWLESLEKILMSLSYEDREKTVNHFNAKKLDKAEEIFKEKIDVYTILEDISIDVMDSVVTLARKQ